MAFALPTSSTDVTFASNRFGFPTGMNTVVSGAQSCLGHTCWKTPPYAGYDLQFLISNFIVDTSGVAAVEVSPGNPVTIDFVTVLISGTWYQITVGGQATNIRLADGASVWTDPLRTSSGGTVAVPANTFLYARISKTNAIGEKNCVATSTYVMPRWSNNTMGDGVEYTSAPQTAKMTSGTVSAYLNGSQTVAPSQAVMKGWDGSNVYMLVGDSIGAGYLDYGWDASTNGVLGYMGRALDDSTVSTRRNFANWCVAGVQPNNESSIAAKQWQKRMQCLRALPNLPFNRIVSEMGQNGFFTNIGQVTSEMLSWWNFLNRYFPGVPIWQTGFPPHQNQTGNMYWTDTAHQTVNAAVADTYPGGIRYAVNDMINSNTGLPSNVTPISTEQYFVDSSSRQYWKTGLGTMTVAATIAAGVGVSTPFTVSASVVPSVGDVLVVNPGVTTSAERLQIYRVVGTTSPYTVYTISNTVYSHAANETIKITGTYDGTHVGGTLSRSAALSVAARKLALGM